MSVLQLTLIICTIAGCWHPPSWTSPFKSTLYKAYRTLLILLSYAFTMSQIMNIILNLDNSNEITETLYMMLAVFVAAYKIASMWINSENVAMIVNALKEKPFKPLESCEVQIYTKYDKTIQNNTLRYLILISTTIVCMILTSIFTMFTGRNLTYRAWLPFDYSSPTIFFLVYTHQLISMSICALINVACDSLICGLLLHICCQFEILEYRLTKIAHGQAILGECVYHHERIFQYANVVNVKLAKIIAVQFIVSMLIVCSNLYQLARAAINAKYIQLVLFTACILAQIFIYCWFGNEVKLKSFQLVSNMYDMEWLTLNKENKKGILLIMRRAMVPIEFTSAHIITMTLESFITLLKTSYSAFNLLQQSQK